MLLVYLASWLLLNVAPRETGYVVVKKQCARKEARAAIAAEVKKQAGTVQIFAAPGHELPEEQKHILKVCSVTLALPPVSANINLPFYFKRAEQFQTLEHSYVYLSTSREPDPPRFA